MCKCVTDQCDSFDSVFQNGKLLHMWHKKWRPSFLFTQGGLSSPPDHSARICCLQFSPSDFYYDGHRMQLRDTALPLPQVFFITLIWANQQPTLLYSKPKQKHIIFIVLQFKLSVNAYILSKLSQYAPIWPELTP